MNNESTPICSLCQATAKAMSNKDGQFWVCDDCKDDCDEQAAFIDELFKGNTSD